MKEFTLKMTDVEYLNFKGFLQREIEFIQKTIERSPDTAKGEAMRQNAAQALDLIEGLAMQLESQEQAIDPEKEVPSGA